MQPLMAPRRRRRSSGLVPDIAGADVGEGRLERGVGVEIGGVQDVGVRRLGQGRDRAPSIAGIALGHLAPHAGAVAVDTARQQLAVAALGANLEGRRDE